MITETAEPPEDVPAVQALADAVERHDGVAALSEETRLQLRSPSRPARHLLARSGSSVVGYAQALLDDGGSGSAELCVHPAHRRRGIGTDLLEAVRTTPGVAVWAHGDLPAARALAGRAGLVKVRELLRMAVDLAPAGGGGARADSVPRGERTAATERPGLLVSEFVPGRDEEAWVRLNARAFADHPEQGRMTVADLRAREEEDWFDPTLLWLARPAARPDTDPVASMWVKAVPGADSGEIYALGVDPAAQGQGLGGLLTGRALDELARRGLRTATLYVEGDNVAARRTYERRGFTCVAIDAQYR